MVVCSKRVLKITATESHVIGTFGQGHDMTRLPSRSTWWVNIDLQIEFPHHCTVLDNCSPKRKVPHHSIVTGVKKATRPHPWKYAFCPRGGEFLTVPAVIELSRVKWWHTLIKLWFGDSQGVVYWMASQLTTCVLCPSFYNNWKSHWNWKWLRIPSDGGDTVMQKKSGINLGRWT